MSELVSIPPHQWSPSYRNFVNFIVATTEKAAQPTVIPDGIINYWRLDSGEVANNPLVCVKNYGENLVPIELSVNGSNQEFRLIGHANILGEYSKTAYTYLTAEGYALQQSPNNPRHWEHKVLEEVEVALLQSQLAQNAPLPS